MADDKQRITEKDENRVDGIVSHIEILSADTRRSSEFYTKVFGWICHEYELDGKPYMGWKPESGEGVPGGFRKMVAGQEPITINYVKTFDIDDVIKKIRERGGTITLEKKPIPGIGFIACFIDPFGNTLGLFQPE